MLLKKKILKKGVIRKTMRRAVVRRCRVSHTHTVMTAVWLERRESALATVAASGMIHEGDGVFALIGLREMSI